MVALKIIIFKNEKMANFLAFSFDNILVFCVKFLNYENHLPSGTETEGSSGSEGSTENKKTESSSIHLKDNKSSESEAESQKTVIRKRTCLTCGLHFQRQPGLERHIKIKH
ncbi:CLUMA_CG020408, isoform A [Clunio marinus]|uniref:CLUMA_CG020408, isoform A n=1 Tax=Clunio marinus TaxID=568069 RepID=A0A1J1J4W0_9DIPT|nr:CLUMA_CG020408, isoform A [Clunio marinus]